MAEVVDEAEDRRLLAGCIAGDRRAWNRFVERFSRYVYYLTGRTAARYGAAFTAEELADLHNDVFVALMEDDCRRLRAFEGRNGCSVRSWIRIITVRRALDALRRRRPHVSLDVSRSVSRDGDGGGLELVDPGPDPLAALLMAGDAARRRRVAELFDGLSEADRLLLNVLYEQRLSVEAACALLRIKRGALYTRKTRLLRRLHGLAVSRGLVEPAP